MAAGIEPADGNCVDKHGSFYVSGSPFIGPYPGAAETFQSPFQEDRLLALPTRGEFYCGTAEWVLAMRYGLYGAGYCAEYRQCLERRAVYVALGTLPLMLLTGIAGNYIKRFIPFNLSTWLPTLFLIMGAWFILRGANLDIPFLSPLIYPEGMVTCN